LRRWIAVLAVAFGFVLAPSGVAQTSGGFQLFVRVDGSVPDWSELSLTVTNLQLGGVDATTRKRFLVTAFQGSQQLSILRSAAGSARFLVSGASPAGSIDQIRVTLGASSLTTEPGGRSLPIVVKSGSVLLRQPRPFVVSADGTVSLVAAIRLGVDAVVKGAEVELRPTLPAELFASPGPENFLDSGEIVEGSGITQRFSELDVEVLRAKLLDESSGAVRDVTLRTDSGAVVSFAHLRRENEALWRSRHGSLKPALVERLGSLAPSDLVTAELYLLAPGPQTLVSGAATPQAWVQAHADFVAQRQAAAEPVVTAIAAALTEAGATVLATSIDPPRLRIAASRAVLETVAAHLDGVVELTEAPTETSVLGTNAAADLMQHTLPQWLYTPETPDPVLRIALHDDRPCIKADHEAFSSVDGFGLVIEPPPEACEPGEIHAGHSTQVAGALAAMVPDGGLQPPDPQRPSPGVIGVPQSYIIQADNCAVPPVEKNPHIASVSCIEWNGADPRPSAVSRKGFDDAVFAHRIFVANGSGNLGAGPLQSQNTAFCPSYNALCVGGYDHNNTIGPAHFGDDIPKGGWENFDGREEPDLVGPYNACLPDATRQANVNYKDIGWICVGGTSFATPLVAGTAAILMANFPASLVNDPSLTRAVLMASASHSMPGAPRVPNYNDNIDDRAGAGAPRVDRAKVILENNRFFSEFVDRDTDFDAAGYLKTPISFHAEENDRVRVVLTYDQCQNSNVSTEDVLDPDLDLTAVENSLQPALFVHGNNSHLDNTEILEFTVARGATVNLFVRAQFWDPCSSGARQTHLAIAWDTFNVGPPPVGG
jgi:hypothetical protein